MKTNYTRFIVVTFIILFVKTFLNAQTPPDETYTQNPFGGNLVLSSAYCQPYDSCYYEEEDYTEWYYDWNYVWRIEVPKDTAIKFEYTKNTFDYFEIYTNNVNGYRQFAYDYSTGTKSVTVFSSDGYIYVKAWTCYYGEPPTGNIFNVNFAIDSNFSMTNGSYNNGNVIVNGKLGIGTVMPSEQLEVVGNAKISNKFAIGTSPYSSSKFSLYNNTENTSQTIYNYKSTTNSTYGINITTRNYSGNTYGIYSYVSGQTGKKWAGYFYGGDVVTMGGYMGIGTSTPNAILDISGQYGYLIPNFRGAGGLAVTAMNLDPYFGDKLNPFKTSGKLILGINYSGGRGEQSFIANSNTTLAGGFSFYNYRDNASTASHLMTIEGSGKVGIGTTTPDSLLTVRGGIHARSVVVDLVGPLADYVFEPEYNLMPLNEVESFVKKNKHLPSIPSAKDVENKGGVNIGEMQNKLLEKIEELTLYVIQQQKEIDALKDELKRK